jgi:hypothetical protein
VPRAGFEPARGVTPLRPERSASARFRHLGLEASGRTPDSVLARHSSHRRLLAWWVLPTLAVAAATGPNRTFGPGRALRPCSPPHSRLAYRITAVAGGLLPHRFTPHPHPERAAGGSALCCGCGHRKIALPVPQLVFSLGRVALRRAGSREVPPGDQAPGGGPPLALKVQEGGLEPPRPLRGTGPQPVAYASSATPASMGREGVEPSAPGLKGQYSTC